MPFRPSPQAAKCTPLRHCCLSRSTGRSHSSPRPTGSGNFRSVAMASVDSKEWSGIGSKYAASNYLKDTLEITNVRRLLYEQIGPKQGFRLLDVGCGCGKYSTVALQLGASHVTGIDNSAAMISTAKQQIIALMESQQLPATFQLHCCSCTEMTETLPPDALEQQFDMALVAYVFCNLPGIDEIQKTLTDIASLLRPGGCLAFVEIHPFICSDNASPIVTQSFGQHQGYFVSEGQPIAVTMNMDNGAQLSFTNRRYTLGMWLRVLSSAGFVLQDVVEPHLSEATGGVPPGLELHATTPKVAIFKCFKL